ncbi:elongation factor P [Schlesneria paludicola]|uniref:elongation factor P n=1 Tax=Schlesneria paludicola TaxID=360056 RepID=UPI00029AC65A|nr:elongation factor P [Schlesneria paludicola]
MSVKIVGELQSGNVIIIDNNPVIVIKAQYNKSGRNAAVVKLKVKNLMTNRVSELVYKADEKVEGVMLEKKECTYSYFAPPNHVFVDAEFNQYEIDAETISDLEKYLVPDMTDVCEVTFYEGRPISVVLPKIIIREVEYTEPVVRGDTSGKITKAAILKDSKHELQVTQFVEIGDKIEIDTESGEFRRRCT